MMLIKKASTVASANAEDGKTKNGVGGSRKECARPVDHWAFLDEIEAPTWVDLALECNSFYEDKEDEWFQTSHPFHHCSSRQLISTLSQFGKGCANSDFCIQEPSSPNLPPSVSRSRGKDYKSREWGQGKSRLTQNKPVPVQTSSHKPSYVNLGFGMSVKEEPSDGELGKHANSTSGSIGKSSLAEVALPGNSNSMDSLCNRTSCSKFVVSKGGETSSMSTVTSEDTKEHHVKVSCKISGRVGDGLLPALRANPRKSCITRQASRMEIKDGCSLEGRKSTSSKSSVGSSSNPIIDGKNVIAAQSSEKTPDSRKIMEMAHSFNHKLCAAKMSKASSLQAQKVSGQIVGHTDGLLSTVRISLRKSCFTRQASRMDIKPMRPSEGQKSTSKSSVINTGHGKNLIVKQSDDKIPVGKSIRKMTQAPHQRVGVAKVSKAPTLQVQKASCNSKQGIRQESLRAKVQHPTVSSKVLVPQGENENSPPAVKEVKKTRDPYYTSKILDGAKGNASSNMDMTLKASTRNNESRNAVQKFMKRKDQNVMKQQLVGTRVKSIDRNEPKKPASAAAKVYFRAFIDTGFAENVIL